MRILPLLLALFQQSPDFRSDLALVHVDVEVRLSGHTIDGLDVTSFRIRDGGKVQPSVKFAHAEEPLDVVLLLDTSDSMRVHLDAVAASAREALQNLRSGDRVAVMAFDCQTSLVAGFSSDFAAVEKSISSVLSRVFSSCSPIQRALSVAAEQFQNPSVRAKRAVVVITDDRGSEKFPVAVQSLWKADAVVFGLIVSKPKTGQVMDVYGYMGAKPMADQTGGDLVDAANAGEALGQAFQRMRNRYSLYYAMPPARAGSIRKIEVELSPSARRLFPKAEIRSRSAYIVPTDPVR